MGLSRMKHLANSCCMISLRKGPVGNSIKPFIPTLKQTVDIIRWSLTSRRISELRSKKKVQAAVKGAVLRRDTLKQDQSIQG